MCSTCQPTTAAKRVDLAGAKGGPCLPWGAGASYQSPNVACWSSTFRLRCAGSCTVGFGRVSLWPGGPSGPFLEVCAL